MRSRSAPFFAAIRWCCVLCLGMVAARPFLTDGLVTSGDGFNYSLSVADAVHQERAGEFPALVGQTRYAFNGRIHPARTAPYLDLLAQGIDLATGGSLDAWEIQNACLIVSFLFASVASYAALVWAAEVPALLAVFLAGIFVLSPALLGAAYSFDLFMSVTAAGFIPVALAGCLRGARQPSLRADVIMTVGLAGAWLAHPPIALWLTLGVGFVRLGWQARSGTGRSLATLGWAAVLFLLLAAFVFVSVRSLGLPQDGGPLRSGPPQVALAHDIVRTARAAFAGALAPVSRSADSLSDIQLGYAGWLLAVVAAGWIATGRRNHPGTSAQRGMTALLLGFAGFLLVLVLPVPGLTSWLWLHLPRPFIDLTNVWPMYRLYLVALGFLIFGAGPALSFWYRSGSKGRIIVILVSALALGWSGLEARAFLHRARSGVMKSATVKSAYEPSNLDISVIAYALVGAPTNLTEGVVDPEFQFRLTVPGRDGTLSNFDAARQTGPIIGRAQLVAEPKENGRWWGYPEAIILEPGRRYLLTFGPATDSKDAVLILAGRRIHRVYSLEGRGGDEGFGLRPGNNRSLVLWTDSPLAESVTARVYLGDQADLHPRKTFAEMTIQEVREESLPIRLKSHLPLRFEVDAPVPGCSVITPRIYVPGYRVTVDGRQITPVRSPDSQLMFPISHGTNLIEVTYAGSGWLRPVFWIGLVTWCLVVGSLFWTAPAVATAGLLRGIGRLAWRRRGLTLAYAAGVVAAGLGVVWAYRPTDLTKGSGPVRIDFRPPWGAWGHTQPLLATGHLEAGTVISVVLVDPSHIRIQAEAWGRGIFLSEPIACDYTQVQSLYVSDASMYPASDEAFRALPPATRQSLRDELLILLNGEPVIDQRVDTFPTKPAEFEFGSSHFGAQTERRFLGRILARERLSLPSVSVTNGDAAVSLNVRFSAIGLGRREPLVYAKNALAGVTLEASSLPGNRVRFDVAAENGEELASGEFHDAHVRDHQLHFSMFPPALGGPAAYGVEVDGGRIFWPATVRAAAHLPTCFVTGLNEAKTGGVEKRFTGGRLELVREPGVFSGAGNRSTGAIDLLVRFPDHPVDAEPLVVTGRPGRGDLVYVRYLDSTHIRIGFDHWAVGGSLSEPIAVTGTGIHALRVSLGNLYADDSPEWKGVAPKVEAALRGTWWVEVDGKRVITWAQGSFPTDSGRVDIGRNSIGGSTCAETFSGEVLLAQRAGILDSAASQ